MGIGKKMSKGSIGGGVNISHKSKMSQSAKNQMGFSNGMPGPNVVGRGMAQYMAGESVGLKKMGKKAAYKLGDLSVEAGIDNNPEVSRADIIVGAKKKSPKQMGEMEKPPMSEGPTKRTRAERQADRDSKKTTRRAKRADKRIKRNEKKVDKLDKKVKEGKEIFNVDDAGNKTTGRKANRIKRAKKKIETNKKISQKGKDLKKKKGEETTKKVKAETNKVDQADKNLKKLNFKSTKKDPGGPIITRNGVDGQMINDNFVPV